jgi:hypothetical protein
MELEACIGTHLSTLIEFKWNRMVSYSALSAKWEFRILWTRIVGWATRGRYIDNDLRKVAVISDKMFHMPQYPAEI